jgi:hypothetical protein
VEEEEREEACVPEATHSVIGLSVSQTSVSSNDSSNFRKTPLEIRDYRHFYAYFLPVPAFRRSEHIFFFFFPSPSPKTKENINLFVVSLYGFLTARSTHIAFLTYVPSLLQAAKKRRLNQ